MIAAGADFAFVRNSSAWAIGHDDGERIVVTHLTERRPGRVALRPSVTFRECAHDLVTAGARIVMADIHYRESAREAFEPFGITLRGTPATHEPHVEFRRQLLEDVIDLRAVASERLAKQLAAVRGTDGSGDKIKITLETAADGSHGDLVAALVLVAWQLRHVRQRARASGGRRERGRALTPREDAR